MARVLAPLASLFAVSVLYACGLTVQGKASADGERDDAGATPIAPPAGSATCGAGLAACAGGACVNLASSASHCGACGNACRDGTVCEGSSCVVACEPDALRCGGNCVDPQTDSSHCGGCDAPCGDGLACVAGRCLTDCGALTRCAVDGGADVCVDTGSDVAHCGGCGEACAAGETCQGGSCRPLCAGAGVLTDTFGPTMVGCRASVTYTNRASLCPPGAHVCGAAEYVARRAGVRPTYNYWTNDNLRHTGSASSCAAVTAGGYDCVGNPMRVCAGPSDPLGNQCNWSSCGFQTSSPNEYFGGCLGNTTAGALCCR